MEKKNSLRWYKVKEKPNKENIYDGSLESTLLFKARTDSLEVNEKKKRWGGETDRCEKCIEDGTNSQIETLEHFIAECKAYETERADFENKIKNRIGEGVWERRKMEDDRGIKLILGLEKNRGVVDDTKLYLREIWKKRGKKQKNQVTDVVEHNYTKRNI